VLIRLLSTHLRPYGRTLVFLVLLQLVQIVATLLLPTLDAAVIDNGVVRGDTGYILRTGVVMVAVSLAQISSSIGAAFFGSRAAIALGRDLRSAVFRRVLHFSAREVGQFGTPSLLTRTVNDVQQVQTLAQTAFEVGVSAPIMCLGGIALALYQDVPLAVVPMGLVLAVALAVSLILARMGPLYELMQTCIDQINRVLREQITGVRVVRAFVREGHERDRFRRANAELFGVSLRVGRLTGAIFPVVLLVTNVFSVALVWFGGRRIDAGAIQLGALSAFLSYSSLIVLSIIMAMFAALTTPRARVAAARIREVLQTTTSVPAPDEPARPGRRGGHLDLRAVEFRYPGAEEPVLRGIDLVARPGETVAVLGSTGSGKTTLLNLVLRLIDATGGSVNVNGVDVRRLDPAVLTRTVGFVPQQPYLFSGTVATNLRYGRPEATDADLWRALEIAQAREFVERMPDRLDAPIAQGGTNVSGGQRQRLAIARTLLRRPEIYLFDDCFSALDYATDAALRAALAPLTSAATVLVVAQRISTIRRADRIVVLDQGRVVGTGTHADLMRGNRTYRDIARSQLTGQEAAHAHTGQP
jgi:ATP-binding cassette subfamily B multidrug efflux pump